MATSNPARYRLVYIVKYSHLDATKSAIFATGAGSHAGGKYVEVAFETRGNGQFMPVAAAGAAPHTGTVDQLEKVEEVKVEILCEGEEVAKKAVEALKRTHPYEVVDYGVYKLEDF